MVWLEASAAAARNNSNGDRIAFRLRSLYLLRRRPHSTASRHTLRAGSDPAGVIPWNCLLYQLMLDRLERAETVAAIRRGIEQAERGEAIPLGEAEKRLCKKHGFSR